MRALGGNRLASLFQDEFLEQPIKKNGIVLLDFAQQHVAILRFARSDMRECVNTLDRMSDASKAQNSP